MDILFCKWGIYGENDVIAAMRHMGYNVDVIMLEREPDYSVKILKQVSGLMDKKVYQYVFSINFIPIVSRVCNIYKTIYISWSVDSPEFMLYSNAIYNKYNRIFIFDKFMYEKFHRENPGCIFYMPLGTSVEHWDTIHVNRQERKKYSCDISFVGSLYIGKAKYNTYEMAKILPPYLKGYMEGAMEAQMKIYGYNFMEDIISTQMAEEFKKYAAWEPLGEDYRECVKDIVVHDFLGLKMSEMERIRMLQALSERFQVDLYSLDKTEQLKNVRYKGTVDYVEEMPKVFKCSKINLNFTSKGIPSGIPLRIFDIIGAKGFVITNYQSEIAEYFNIGEEIVVYESREDLIQKVSYYLEHEEERQQIVENGYRKVKEMFTWEARLKDIFYIVENIENQ